MGFSTRFFIYFKEYPRDYGKPHTYGDYGITVEMSVSSFFCLNEMFIHIYISMSCGFSMEKWDFSMPEQDGIPVR